MRHFFLLAAPAPLFPLPFRFLHFFFFFFFLFAGQPSVAPAEPLHWSWVSSPKPSLSASGSRVAAMLSRKVLNGLRVPLELKSGPS